MKRTFLSVLGLLFVLLVSSSAFAGFVVIDFEKGYGAPNKDKISRYPSVGASLSAYDGFCFHYLGILNTENESRNRGYYRGGVPQGESRGMVGYNDHGRPLTISRLDGGAFNFLGGYFSAANYYFGEILITAFDENNQLIFEGIIDVLMPNDAELGVDTPPTYYDMSVVSNTLSDSDFSGNFLSEIDVHSLTFTSQNFQERVVSDRPEYQFVMDNLNFYVDGYDSIAMAFTPEPASLLILASGTLLGGFYVSRKRSGNRS